MTLSPDSLYPNKPDGGDDVLAALREFLARHREAAAYGPETLAELFFEFRYLPQRPEVFEVEVALEALRDDEGELLL